MTLCKGQGRFEGVAVNAQLRPLLRSEALLAKDLARFEAGVGKAVTVELNQNQFDACVSLAFNIGLDAFRKSSLLGFINERDWPEATAQFSRWNKTNGKVLAGLVSRRAEEAALFARAC